MGLPCAYRARYRTREGRPVCGIHAREKDKERQIPDHPRNIVRGGRSIKQLEEHLQSLERAASANRRRGRRGSVTYGTAPGALAAVSLLPGVLNVFPNAGHAGRRDGLGISALSPDLMGPVEHRQPRLPPAASIQNFEQGNRVFPWATREDGSPSERFRENQLALYADVNCRGSAVSAFGTESEALYSVWTDPATGEERRFNCVESRQFYCTYYERLATSTPDFWMLSRMLEDGYNLRIMGCDGRNVSDCSMESCYLDPSQPFRHELVLYTMLREENEGRYPWRIHATERIP
jgi:hypothetical protein